MLDRMTTSAAQLPAVLPLSRLASLTQVRLPLLPAMVPPVRLFHPPAHSTSTIFSSLTRYIPPVSSLTSFVPSHRQQQPYSPENDWKRYAIYTAGALATYTIARRWKRVHDLDLALDELQLSDDKKTCIKYYLRAHHMNYTSEKASNVHDARVWVLGRINTLAEEADRLVLAEESWTTRLMYNLGLSDCGGKYYKKLGGHEKRLFLAGWASLHGEKHQGKFDHAFYKQALVEVDVLLQQKNLELHERNNKP